MIDTVLFDLDGTLLPMDQDQVIAYYLNLLVEYVSQYDYEPKKLAKTIWEGTGAMMKNDTGRANEQIFWDRFREVYGPRAETDQSVFEEFYATEYGKVRTACGFRAGSAELVKRLKERGIRLILATQPLFPEIATRQRVRWAGLDPADFAWITTYENSCFCKPNPEYYREILDRFGLKPEQCLMVGNDAVEDMAAEALGMRVFLLTDCLLHEDGQDLSRWSHGNWGELEEYLEQNL